MLKLTSDLSLMTSILILSPVILFVHLLLPKQQTFKTKLYKDKHLLTLTYSLENVKLLVNHL